MLNFRYRRLFLSGFIILLFSVLFLIKDIFLSEPSVSHGCSEKSSLYINYKNDGDHKITYCSKMDKDIMQITSKYFSVNQDDKYLVFDYIGYPENDGLSIYIEDNNSHTYVVKNLKKSAGQWVCKIVELPKYMTGKVRIVAEDNATMSYGWTGLGNVYLTSDKETVKFLVYLKTFGYILLFSFFITGIFSLFLKKRDPLEAFIGMSLFVGIAALVSFNIYLFSLSYGSVFSWGLFLFSLYGLLQINRHTLKMNVLFLALLVSMMSVVLFIAYSDIEIVSNFQVLSANRWHHLPIDNWIPKFFADAILKEHIPSPLFGSWLSSDRPPLQTGFFLIFSIISSTDFLYLVTASGMQLLVIIFIAMLLMHYVKEKIYIFFVMFLIFFNGFVFVHALFVWPKLLSSLYQGIAFYFVYKLWISQNKLTKDYMLFGIASSLAFLSHGGSVFYLLTLGILLLFTIKNKVGIRQLFYGFFVSFVIYLPWLLYQKLMNPPGDRLLKWHLAGKTDVTNETFIKVFMNYYEKLSLSEWLSLQIAHFERIYYSFYISLPKIFSLPHNKFLDSAFFSTDYSFLFFTSFLSILYFFIKERLGVLKTFVLLLLSSYFIYTVIWSLILTRGTVIHQGSYFAWFSAFIAVSFIVYQANKILFYILTILNLTVFMWIYMVPCIFHKDTISGLVVLVMTAVYGYCLYILTSNQISKKYFQNAGL